MRSAAVIRKSLRLPLLLSVSVLIWLYATDCWRPDAWRIPASYVIDSLEMLARLKVSGDKGLGLLIDKTIPGLGAPWVADWSAYPMPDTPGFIVLGWIATVIGLVPASNFALLFAHLSAVLLFYVCSRALGHRPVFAASAALLFGFSFYVFHRGLSHYSFALAGIVPVQLLSVWLIGASRRLLALRRWRWFCLATAVATAAGNPYFGLGYCQLLLFALLYQAATLCQRRNLVLGLACLAVFAVTLVGLNYSSLLAILGGQAGLLERNYAGTEIYGLRPIELIIPPYAHHWAFAAEIARRYAAATSLKGELFFSYLGLAGVAGLLVIAITAGRQLIRHQAGLRPAHAATVAWFIGCFMVGGLNSLLAFAGIDLFRAGNRYSIYLLAVALFALASWATRRGHRLGTWTALGVAVPLVLAGLWDQIPRRRSPAESNAFVEKIAADRMVARRLETELPAGSAVFQLPVVPFLEQAPVNRMTDYELFRPWLYSRHVRFSYGLLAGDRALRWQKWIAARPVDQMCAALEQAGYAAVYFHRAAFPDSGAALRGALAALGKKPLVEAGDHVVFALQPAGQPSLPDLTDPRLTEPWNRVAEADDQPQLYATDGWFALEHRTGTSWRWAGQAATVTIWCPGGKPADVSLEFGAAALQPARLSAMFNGREIWQVPADGLPAPAVRLRLTLQPGANRIVFSYAGRPTRPSATDPRRLGFSLDNLRAILVDHP